jgi:hypothetical protein
VVLVVVEDLIRGFDGWQPERNVAATAPRKSAAIIAAMAFKFRMSQLS